MKHHHQQREYHWNSVNVINGLQVPGIVSPYFAMQPHMERIIAIVRDPLTTVRAMQQVRQAQNGRHQQALNLIRA